MTPQETLAWEAERRPRAAIAAFVAAGLTILGGLFTTIGLPGAHDFDNRIVTVVDAMGRAANGQPIPAGRISAYALHVGNHPALPIAGAVLYGLGSLALFFPMAFLFRAVRARRPGLAQVALVVAAIGAVGFGIGRAVAEVARYVGATGFVDSVDKSNSAASDALSPTSAVVGQVVWQAGALALGFAFVLISLNAMRVGLLTRFMGVLGMIVGATFVLPIDQQGIIRVFWMAALGLLILGRWPRGVPKAWISGEAEPWPTQQQIREQREAARRGEQPPQPAAPPAEADAADETRAEPDEARSQPAERKGPRTPAPTAPSPRRPDATTVGSHSSSKKRKRKRRS
jgi:hypothetical protein